MNLPAFINKQFGWNVRGAITDDGRVVIVGKDISNALGIRYHLQALERLDADEKVTVRVELTRCTTPGQLNGKRRGQDVVCVTESGLYALIFMSRKTAAKMFRKWVTAEVLPALREYGAYSLHADPGDLEAMRLENRVGRQYHRIIPSMKALGQPVPDGYGTIGQFVNRFGLDLSKEPGKFLRIVGVVRSLASERGVSILYIWNVKAWRAQGHYPCELVQEAVRQLLPGFQPPPDLFS